MDTRRYRTTETLSIVGCTALLVVVMLVSQVFTGVAYAHKGRTDDHGYHTDHATGEYHGHNPKPEWVLCDD